MVWSIVVIRFAGMRLIVRDYRHWGFVLCAVAVFGMAGCRSRMPRMNWFGLRGEPSPDKLAGAGPSTTYPMPPSSGVKPEAIASVAGGTAAPNSGSTPQLASSTTPKTPTTPTTPTVNYAAATANRAYPPPGTSPSTTTQPVGFTAPAYAQTPAPTSGGTKSTSPPSVPAYGGSSYMNTPNSPNVNPTGTAAASATQPSGYVFGQKTTAPTVAPSTTPSVTAPTTSAPAGGMGGFALPEITPSTGSVPSIASAAGVPTASPNYAAPSVSGTPTASPGAYTPGTTSGSGYPTGGYSAPSGTGGSFYR